MIEIKTLSKNYGSKQALKNINLTIPQGEIIGLFGENGAGKTTLIKSIFGFIRYKGQITLDGKKITNRNIERLSFATCEHSFFPNLSPKAHMYFYKNHFRKFNEKRFNGLMKFFNLPENKALVSFSQGQKKQFEVILALSQGADYIFMDEPFAGNDIFNREDFYKVLLGILEPNETILLSTHLVEEVSEFIGRAVLIHEGEIIGDKTVIEIEEEGSNLVNYIKQSFNYKIDRVAKALDEINSREE